MKKFEHTNFERIEVCLDQTAKIHGLTVDEVLRAIDFGKYAGIRKWYFSTKSRSFSAATIVNVKKAELNKRGISDFEEWSGRENTLYIGRNMNFYVKGALGSKWANPFSAKKFGREECLRLYEERIRQNEDLMGSLDELRGKELGCWCKPEGCHGDILIKLLKNK